MSMIGKTKFQIQSTLVISKSKGLSETLRDIRNSTYQICRIEENTNRTTKFYKWTCNLTPLVRNICWKYCGNGEKFLLLSTIFSYLMLDFYVKTRVRFSLRDKRLFEITEVDITRVDCSTSCYHYRIFKPPSVAKVIYRRFRLNIVNTVNSRYLDFGYLEQPLFSKKNLVLV